ncbi:MAG: PQQ-dependent dehydrogenase, methanol/ethanol family [Rhodocyclaceae bacterium]|nr:PQQ-dependent dehydrogenase, methanol/ethanol family [Rhodocyclaceae bacterium]
MNFLWLSCTLALFNLGLTAAVAREVAPGDWPGFGRDAAEQHYSPLADINESTIGRLNLAWYFDIPGTVLATSSPVAANGVLYFTTGYSVIRAVDGATGRLLWTYDPRVSKVAGKRMRAAWGSRGLAYAFDGRRGSVYLATHDGRLIALDAGNGRPRWIVQTLEQGDSRYITGAPRVFNGTVIIGHGGADFGPVRGYVTAYNATTGKRIWRFHTVPGDPAKGFENAAMAMAAKTWTGEWWKFGGGGTVWNAITYDPEFDAIYIGTGNGQPWNWKIRSPQGGDNLFLCSIVALDAKSGRYKWHYQTNPAESWDYNAAMDIELATLTIDGRARKVLMQAPKNGFFYVIDRSNGKLISAEKITKVTWAERIDLTSGRPIEAQGIRYENGSAIIWPGSAGAHNWHPMAFSPQTGLVYIPTINLPGVYDDSAIDRRHWQSSKQMQASFGVNIPSGDIPLNAGNSFLQAWDPISQRQIWQVPNPGLFNGGVMATAGNLVFQGQPDGRFNAYAADSGKALWGFDAQVGVLGAPISYLAKGRQYVAVLAGMGSGAAMLGSPAQQFGWDARSQKRRVLVFTLDGQASLPTKLNRLPEEPLTDTDYVANPEQEKRGDAAYSTRCHICHGIAGIAAGSAPDLRRSPLLLNSDGFRDVIQHGTRVGLGMPRYENLMPQDIDDIRQFLRGRNRASGDAAKGVATNLTP